MELAGMPKPPSQVSHLPFQRGLDISVSTYHSLVQMHRRLGRLVVCHETDRQLRAFWHKKAQRAGSKIR